MGSVTNLQEVQQRNLKIGAIIQARMTSNRFPGKSMALLQGKPVVQHVIERVKLIKTPKGIKAPIKTVLAVPDTHASEPMLIVADMMRIDNFCGDEKDVLNRYYGAARFFKFDIVIRVTADCPFLDPIVCADVLNLLLWRRLDYVSNLFPVRTYPLGLDCEVFTFDALEAAHMMTKLDYDREHVTPWMQRTEDIKRACVSQKIDASNKNWCIDEPEDIQRLENEIKLGNIVHYKPLVKQ